MAVLTMITILQLIDMMNTINERIKMKRKTKRSNTPVISVSPKSKSPLKSKAIEIINNIPYRTARRLNPPPFTRSPNRSPVRRPFYEPSPDRIKPNEANEKKLSEFY